MKKQIDFVQLVKDYKIALIVAALEDNKGNAAKAAQQLSLNRTTLVEILKKLKIDRRDFKEKGGDE